jgi:hypothetical protein
VLTRSLSCCHPLRAPASPGSVASLFGAKRHARQVLVGQFDLSQETDQHSAVIRGGVAGPQPTGTNVNV